MKPKVLIMSGYGINCEAESAYAFSLAGGAAEIVHINDLITAKKKLSSYDIMMFPGGFSYGDDTGSGNAFANKVRNNLWDELMEFINDGKLILGVCNGFQIMVHLGLFSLPFGEYGKRTSALKINTQNRYECRWVYIRHEKTRCVFTKGINTTHLPIAHGEGNFYCDSKTLKELNESCQIVFRYCDEKSNFANGVYPANPNGSLYDIAGICDRTGRIMGMMPHPERAIFPESDPLYHLKKETAKRNRADMPDIIASNLKIFKNAVDYFNV